MASLYIHIPFCEKKCFYCSFVIAVGQENKIDQYLKCLKIEAQKYKGTKIETIYVGGGTPSLLNTSQINQLFEIIYETFDVEVSLEISFEFNPESVEQNKVSILKKLGVNRMSLGVQSFNEQYLKYLGRNHSEQSALNAYRIIHAENVGSINVDMMFMFPGQTIMELEDELKIFTQMKSEHLSLYTLTLEKNSRFFTKNIKLDSEKLQAKYYEIVRKVLENEGFKQYEISNFSKEGYQSQHNLNYWSGGEYIGLGVGAHSFFNGRMYWNVSRLMLYMKMIQDERSAIEHAEQMSVLKQCENALLFGLRMNSGVDINELEKRYGKILNSEQYDEIHNLIKSKLLLKEGNTIRVSDKGRLVLDEICSRLIS
ncbi:MAG: radical SAM family heme chaperone HemW [Candidatus Omnitrophica bacterium]|nr:radical SAM family heme chaperone HemW [Candidatus Omnitrophota bacterium]